VKTATYTFESFCMLCVYGKGLRGDRQIEKPLLLLGSMLRCCRAGFGPSPLGYRSAVERIGHSIGHCKRYGNQSFCVSLSSWYSSVMRQLIRENTSLRRLYYRLKSLRSRGQSNESRILSELARDAPRTFIEFGFHPIEFNCAALARNPAWRGLLIDGSLRQVEDARAILPSHVEAVQSVLALDNLDLIRSKFKQLGVLSIDVDGNDYWFLKALIDINPTVICVEYNASFGLEPISVPYDPTFDRHEKHPSGWYHGASLTAVAKLCASNGYGLAAISDAGANAFFTRTGKLDPVTSWRPNTLRDQWSGTNAQEQYLSIRGLPFVEV